LLLAEPLDQDAAALAVREQPGALGPRGFASLGPGGFGRRLHALVALAAIVPAQRRVVLPPRVAAARPARRLLVARRVPALPPSLVAAAKIAPLAVTPRPALLAAAPLPAVRWAALVALRRLRFVLFRLRDDRRGEIALRLHDHPLAELVAQHAGAYLLDRALRQLAQLERAERDADQPVHLQAEMAQHVAHLAVLALADREGEPDVRALGRLAVERRLDRAVMDAVHGDAVAQRVELGLRHPAKRAHAIAPQPAGFRQLQHAGEPAVVGEQQQPLGAHVEPAHREHARQPFRQRPEDGRPPFRVGVGGHQPARLVIEEEAGCAGRRGGRAVARDAVGGAHVAGRRVDHLAVDRDPAGRDPRLRLAARGEPGAGDRLGDPLAAFGAVLVALAGHGSFHR